MKLIESNIKKTNRIHYTCIRLNDKEMELLNRYMKRRNLTKKSKVMRDALMTKIDQ